jgi:EAL domain-containing protein (putative c-di-GMP-specific phosphodiesterase class I)
MGVVWFHADYPRSEVFSRSDLAVESARQSGRNKLVILPDKRDASGALGSFAWRQLIQNALQEDRWVLAAQPVVHLGQPTLQLHHELMARLIDEKANLVPASNFLPMAARHRLMSDVDRALVTLGLDYLRRKTSEHVAINLSFQGMADGAFMEWLGRVLGELKGDATRLSIELSEFACLRNVEAAQRAMSLVRKHGGRFGIDNFGLDPQAVKLLRQMPPDYVKLAGGLIAEVAGDEHTRNIVLSITQLARSLDVKVSAQNVENEAQVAALLAAGVEGGQGYLFGAPS